jgi:hypothetical protein
MNTADVFYSSISDALVEQGNNVFKLDILSYCSADFNLNTLKLENPKLLDEVKDFKPDLVIATNNALPDELANSLTCDICLLDADNPLYFFNKKNILKYPNKYKFIGMQSYSSNLYEQFFKDAFKEENFLLMPSATTMVSEELKIDKNISFIGTNFLESTLTQNKYFLNHRFIPLFKEIKNNFFVSKDEEYKKYKDTLTFKEFDNLFELIKLFYTGQERIKSLDMVSDLGLSLYGFKTWPSCANINLDVFSCHKDELIVDFKSNQRVYNSSKISLNISHPQAIKAFSWRVMDIMATNSCLLMEAKDDWYSLFGDYLTDDVKEAIIYKDKFEIREKAKELLNNEELRLKCVKQCQNAIEKNGRWHHRFKLLENFLNIKINNLDNKDAKIILPNNHSKNIRQVKPQEKKKNLKNNLSLLFSCAVVFIYNLIIPRVFIPRKLYINQLKKISKTYNKEVKN